MKKIAQVQAVWPQIYKMLQAPPAGVQVGSFRLPPINKIILEPGRLAENPQAIGHVSSEDAGEGIIHLNIGRLEEALKQRKVPMEKLHNLGKMTKDELVNVLSAFVETMAHESGHLHDFNPNNLDNPFPGGEAVADAAARSAVQQISVATNIPNKFNKSWRLKMDKKTLNVLAKLAAELDEAGAIKVADKIDQMIEILAQEVPVPMGEDYQNKPVTLGPETQINDERLRPITENRGAASAKRFTADTGVEPGPGLENVAKVQQGLIDLGYDVGSPQPDYDWGPKSTSAWTAFSSDFFTALNATNIPEQLKQQQVRYFESGQVDHILGLMLAFKKIKAPAEKEYVPSGIRPYALYGEYSRFVNDAGQKAYNDALQQYPENDSYAQSQKVKAKNLARKEFKASLSDELLQALETYINNLNAGIGADVSSALNNVADDPEVEGVIAKLTPEEKMNKIASDTQKISSVFWKQPTTPFGR